MTPGGKRWAELLDRFVLHQLVDQMKGLGLKPGGAISDPAGIATTQLPQSQLIVIVQAFSVLLGPWIKAQLQVPGHRLGQSKASPLGGTGHRDQEFLFGGRSGPLPQPMQTGPDLGFLEFAEVGLGVIEAAVHCRRVIADRTITGQIRPVQLSQGCHDGSLQGRGALRAHLPGIDHFIQQGLQPLQGPMQPCPSQRWCQVIEDHGLSPAFRLGPLPWIVDDEGVEMGNCTQDELWPTARTQADAFPGQPFSAAVFPHMHQQLRSLLLPQPEVLGQIPVGWWQIR